jgi:hypothetical protein
MLALPKWYCMRLHKRGEYFRWSETFADYLVKSSNDIYLRPNPLKKARWFVWASFYRLVELTNDNLNFAPLFVYGLWIVVGPWFIGQLAPSSPLWGSFYLYGLHVNGDFLPLLDTWRHAVIPGMLYYIFVVYVLSVFSCRRDLYQLLEHPREKSDRSYPQKGPKAVHRIPISIVRRVTLRLSTFAICLHQLIYSLLIGVYYGIPAFILSPGITWFSLTTIILLVRCWLHNCSTVQKDHSHQS